MDQAAWILSTNACSLAFFSGLQAYCWKEGWSTKRYQE